MDRDKLYQSLEDDDRLTDEEKREAYFEEIQRERDEEDWQDQH
jgi:hypothetical protein